MLFKRLLIRSIVCAFLLCFTFTAVYVPQPFTKHAHAAAAKEDTQLVNTANTFATRVEMAINNSLTTVISSVTSLSWWRENVLNTLGWALAKAILSSIMRDIIRWVNSGFRGSPAFIQDLGGFLTDVADETAGRFIQEVGGPLSIVCSPFRLNVQIALAVSYNRTRDRNARRCTLTGALQNIQNFIGGDFNQGGWNSWLQITQNPGQYTQAGAVLGASAEMGISITNARGEQLTLGNWGLGFLSSKVCDDPQTPAGQPQPAGQQGASQAAQATGEGRNCRISTPGQVISTQLNKALNLGTDSLIAADEINELIGSFMQQMATQAITGVRGLLGAGGGDKRYTNPNFNVDLFTPGMEITTDYTSARINFNESLAASLSYLQLTQSFMKQYESGYSTDPGVQARADTAYAEMRSLLPTLQNNVTTVQSIVTDFDAATTDQDRATVLLRYTTIVSSLPTRETVSGQEARWSIALSGLIPREETTVDRRTILEQIALERQYLTLIDAVIDVYETIGSPSSEETAAAEAAETVRPKVLNNIVTIQDLVTLYNNGQSTEARDGYLEIEPDLTTEAEIDAARNDWETVFGPLP